MAELLPAWAKRIGRRLKLRDLHILFVVVQCGSMAKAAKQLAMSQPAVSEAIAGLEDTLSVRLLDRSPRGVEATIYAHALLKRGHVVFDELKQGIRDIEFLANPATGEIRIGCPESLMAGFLPTILEQLARKFPKVSVHVTIAQPGEQEFLELNDRSVDLLLGRVFKPLRRDDLAMEYLCEDKFYVVAGIKNKWARQAKIELEQLLNESWIFFPENSVSNSYIEKGFLSKGIELPKASVTSFSMQTRFHLLATGRYLTILHASVLKYNAKIWSLKTLPVNLNIRSMPIAIFRMKNRTISPVVDLFIKEAREVSKTMSGISK